MERGESSQQHRVLDQGPVIEDLLFHQRKHRSAHVFRGEDQFDNPLSIRRADSQIWRLLDAEHDRTLHYIDELGFGLVRRIGSIHYDWALIIALSERWRPE